MIQEQFWTQPKEREEEEGWKGKPKSGEKGGKEQLDYPTKWGAPGIEPGGHHHI
jgi:hypothetical protein